jgi:hypothetical protein
MKYILFISCFIVQLFTFSQESKTYDLSSFEELIVIGNFPVKYVKSDRKEAIVSIQDSTVELDNLSFSYSNDELTIKYSGSFVDDIDIAITMYAPKPRIIEARRGTEIRFEDAGKYDEILTLKCRSGGKILIKNVEATDISAEVKKGGSIRIVGKTEVFHSTIKTGGEIAAVYLKAQEVEATVKFGGEILCAPKKRINATVISGGTINYTGDPEVSQKIRLGGNIAKI